MCIAASDPRVGDVDTQVARSDPRASQGRPREGVRERWVEKAVPMDSLLTISYRSSVRRTFSCDDVGWVAGEELRPKEGGHLYAYASIGRAELDLNSLSL